MRKLGRFPSVAICASAACSALAWQTGQAAGDENPMKGDFLNGDPSFAEKLIRRTNLDEPSAVVVVLLPDKTYLTFAPADVLTLKHLVEKLPAGTLKPDSRLSLIRRSDGVIFSKTALQTLDLSRQSLSRWDIVIIKEP